MPLENLKQSKHGFTTLPKNSNQGTLKTKVIAPAQRSVAVKAEHQGHRSRQGRGQFNDVTCLAKDESNDI
ncbi:hypothetical protein TNCV_955321 [Trichonephila clavipes]|nr:hypothetical protein TNCV_955321 [Trichonephila clavipes]